MLKKTITFTNLFTEKEETEDHYFHISKAELVEMNVESHKDTYTNKDGERLEGVVAKWQRIVESEDGKALMGLVKDLIRRSYGKRVANSFHKSPEIWEEFSGSEAYGQLLLELSLDVDAASEFMNSVFPSNAEIEKMAKDLVEKNAKSTREQAVEEAKDPAGLSNSDTPQVLTRAQAAEMDSSELVSGLTTGKYKIEA